MKKFFIIATIATISALSANAAGANNNDTITVSTTPSMHCARCENKIKNNIRFVKGTKKITTSVPNQSVTIIYDKSKSSYSDYATAFKKIGYDIKKKSTK